MWCNSVLFLFSLLFPFLLKPFTSVLRDGAGGTDGPTADIGRRDMDMEEREGGREGGTEGRTKREKERGRERTKNAYMVFSFFLHLFYNNKHKTVFYKSSFKIFLLTDNSDI